MKRQPVQSEEVPTFIGIDYHKAYSVYSVLDAQGSCLGQGRIDHARPEEFRVLVRRWPGCHVVFEAGMNWHWLFEILEREQSSERIVLANPFKTRIIAEAQIRPTRWTRGFWPICYAAGWVPSAHIAGRETRQIRECSASAVFSFASASGGCRTAQSHSSSAWRPARSEVAAMQRPLRPQGPELSRKAGASSAGQASIDPATDALKGTGRAHPRGCSHSQLHAPAERRLSRARTGVMESATTLSFCLRQTHKQQPRKATKIWASTRRWMRCQIGRMASSLLRARKAASTSVSCTY